MNQISKLFADQIQMDKATGAFWAKDLSALSLRIGLKSYFESYRAISGDLSDLGAAGVQAEAWSQYQEAYFGTVLHLHHFFELTLKETLAAVHPFLAADVKDENYISTLNRVLAGQSVPADEFRRMKWVEFTPCLDRLLILIADDPPGARVPSWVAARAELLRQLNRLRNSVWHRGRAVLRYEALDLIMTGHLLPLLKETVAGKEYQLGFHFNFPHQELACGVDPYSELLKLGGPNYHRQKVALLKELSRAGMENPIHPDFELSSAKFDDRGRAEKHARASQIGQPFGVDIEVGTCPVCGVKSVVTYLEPHYISEEDIDGFDTDSIKCECCTFEINPEIDTGVLEAYGLPNYWVKW